MGWTGIYTDRPSKDVVIEELTQPWSEKYGSVTILDIAKKGSTFYLALDRKRPDGKQYVMGMVVLTSRRAGEVAYKEIDEFMGPCESECPKRILDKLSPLDQIEPDPKHREYAEQWRERCRAAFDKPKAKPVADLDVIKLDAPLPFTNGITADTFIVRKTGRKLRFLCDGITYRISKFNTRQFTIIGKVDPATNKIVLAT